MSTLQEHYDYLHDFNFKAWCEMNGKLASRMNKRSNCLTYFERSVLEPEKKGLAADLAILPGWVQKQIVEFMGFTWPQIWANQRPALPTEEPNLELEPASA